VGAYYHDVGKLKRPQFFKENQIGNNPHDKLTPNLSALVIISHTKDGDELAQKYHLPKVIRDIILQHHGTTLMVYFYHKATQTKDELKEETFRYEGPIPDTREAAVVMLADSVEAAIRSMPDKTQGKMEGLVHKIIKDKLDDGQLDRCDLTLKDLSIIADSFMQVLSGVFHERIEYPDLEKKNSLLELDNSIYNIKGQKSLRRDNPDEIDNIQPSEDSENTQ
jgi:putative nucleotidyltransferase with HDIG domain